jgi:hypothetical protein
MSQGREKPILWHAKAAVAALAAVALYGALIQFGVTEQFAALYPDPYQVMGLQERLSRALGRVPPQERVVFFSDVSFDEVAGQAAFFAVQYAFAPRIVLLEKAPQASQARFWLGVFSRQDNFMQIGADRGLLMELDLGGYVVLYRKPEARP